MTIDQLEHFYALSQCRNYTQAANQLYISQPALSKSIQALEKELHLDLVHRNTRTVTLTAEGIAFADTCRDLLHTLRHGINNAKSASGTLNGRVVFGLPSDHYDAAAVSLILALNEKQPGIRSDLKFFPPNGLLRALDNDTVDFIFSSDWPRAENLAFLRVCESVNCAVLPKDHRLADREEISFAELKNEGFLAISYMVSGKEHDLIIELAREAGLSPNLNYEANSFPELLMMVAAGRGVTVLAEEHKALQMDGVSFVPLKDAPKKEENLIWKRSDNPCILAVAELAGKISEPCAEVED